MFEFGPLFAWLSIDLVEFAIRRGPIWANNACFASSWPLVMLWPVAAHVTASWLLLIGLCFLISCVLCLAISELVYVTVTQLLQALFCWRMKKNCWQQQLWFSSIVVVPIEGCCFSSRFVTTLYRFRAFLCVPLREVTSFSLTYRFILPIDFQHTGLVVLP